MVKNWCTLRQLFLTAASVKSWKSEAPATTYYVEKYSERIIHKSGID